MYRTQIFLLALCYLSLVVAAPTQPKKRSFKVHRIRVPNYVPNGLTALRRAYEKFNIPNSPFIQGLNNTDIELTVPGLAASDSDNPGSTEQGQVNASPAKGDREFVSPVTIGGQTVVMDFDTGSSDMWVFSTTLDSASQAGHTIYDPTKSSTFKPMDGATFNVSYGDGSFALGGVGTDTVDIGGASVENQAIGLPTQVDASFVQDQASNGLVGLAFSQLNTIKPQKQKTFFDNIIGDLEEPVFTASLKQGAVGSYEFGNIDQSGFQGQLTDVPVLSNSGFWMFNSQQIAVGNGQPMSVSDSGLAIADTGTSLLIVDLPVVEAYWGPIPGVMNTQNGVVFPCDTALPDLSLAVGDNYMATISGDLMNFAPVGADATGQQCTFLVFGFPLFRLPP